MGSALAVLVAVYLIAIAVALTIDLALSLGCWRIARKLGRLMPHLLGSQGRAPVFLTETLTLRETGQLAEAAALSRSCLADATMPIVSRNVATDVLISAGEYRAALAGEGPPVAKPTRAAAYGLALIQINLSEAEYNLGRWEAAEGRLSTAEAACQRFALTRAGYFQQRAWIAAHRGRATEALALLRAVKPRSLPRIYRAEFHFTAAAALLAAGNLEEAETAIGHAERIALRRSSRRNALFLRARVAAARADWPQAERFCREAANHPFRGQGGGGLLLWARALRELGRHREAEEALRLVVERDPESEAARDAAAMLSSSRNESSAPGSAP